MSWNDPLRHLPPLSEHPSASPSLSPALSDAGVSFLAAERQLDKLRDEHYGAWKILSAFFEHLGHSGKWNLAADVVHCADTDQLVALANHLLDAILKPFKLASGRAPMPLSTPASVAAEDGIDIDARMATIEASSRADQRNLRNDCLRRDNYRCVFSGAWDTASVLKGIVVPSPGDGCAPLQCAHILPFALGTLDSNDAVQTRNKATIWFAIHRYFPEIRDSIDARTINQRQNAVMLDASTHIHFSSYMLAFLPQDGTEYYATWCTNNISAPSKSGSPLFHISSVDSRVPMPNPEYFRVHYIVFKILQVSGLRETITKATEEAYLDLDHHQLQPDGSTDAAALLSRIMLVNVRAEGGSSTS